MLAKISSMRVVLEFREVCNKDVVLTEIEFHLRFSVFNLSLGAKKV